MVLGKRGLRLEAVRFSIYLGIPIIASIYFNSPHVQQYWADYFQYLKFPANPNTRLKEEYEELVKQRALEKEQRKLYAQQLQKLHDSAAKSRAAAADDTLQDEKKKGWFW